MLGHMHFACENTYQIKNSNTMKNILKNGEYIGHCFKDGVIILLLKRWAPLIIKLHFPSSVLHISKTRQVTISDSFYPPSLLIH